MAGRSCQDAPGDLTLYAIKGIPSGLKWKTRLPMQAGQTIDKPCIQERMQGILYERRNSNEATSLLMF